MKNIEEALYLRNHILLTLEEAARNKNIKEAEKLQNIVIAGGGPTGSRTHRNVGRNGKIYCPERISGNQARTF